VITKSWGGAKVGGQYTVGPPSQKVEGDLSPPVPMVVAPMLQGQKDRRTSKTRNAAYLDGRIK